MFNNKNFKVKITITSRYIRVDKLLSKMISLPACRHGKSERRFIFFFPLSTLQLWKVLPC